MQQDPRPSPAPYMGTIKQALQSRNPGQPCMNTRHLVQLTLSDVRACAFCSDVHPLPGPF